MRSAISCPRSMRRADSRGYNKVPEPAQGSLPNYPSVTETAFVLSDISSAPPGSISTTADALTAI